jgi:hypothetical protein
MTNIHTATTAELTTLQSKGAKWLCVAAYNHAGHERGDVLSWHKTQPAAARAAHNEWRKTVELADAMDDTRYFEQAVST